MSLAISSMVSAFGPERELPQRQLVGSSFFMPGRVGDVSGIKIVSVVPGHPAGIVTVFDADGEPIGSVDGSTLTAIRTAAASGLATRVLASPEASSMAMLGAGAMARGQIEAVREVRDIAHVVVWSRSPDRANALAEDVGGIAVASPDEAIANADIVTTATPSTIPLFNHDSLRQAVHINAIGAYTPDMVEIPPQTVQAAFRVVDDYEAARAEAGDLIQAGVSADAELGELLAEPWDRSSDITLFKSVGIASQDIAAAAAALANAENLGLGTVI
jgi:ornithine cyclodeaminase/alanine dehydrogenase-like protein (mu-crystallin family)